MSKSTNEEISSADETVSTVDKDKLDHSFDQQSDEGSITSSDKQSSDDSSLESDSSVHSSENKITEKDILCHFCNKRFANKRSLASHKSRFHRESNRDNTTSLGSIDKMNDSPSRQSEEGSLTSSDKQSGDSFSDSNSSAESSKKGLAVICPYCDKKFADQHRLKSHKNRFHHNEKLDLESSSSSGNGDMGDSDQNSDPSTDGTDNSTTRRRYSLKRKERKHLTYFNATLAKILDSIKQVLQSQHFNEKKDCFDLLSSYKLKKEVFAELEGFIKLERGLDMNIVLSEDELCFVDALLSTKSLTELTKLMNENTKIVESILEQHVVAKRRKYE